MRTLFLPQGAPLTDQQFGETAFSEPLSPMTTFGYGVQNAVEESLLGTIFREAELPAPSGRYEQSRFNSRFIPDTPEQAAAKGEKVYADAEEYKASPWYREEVPFEPGMTAARAEALSNMRDLRAIRDHYAGMRPVAAILGGVAGAALAPENYIPILGEYAGAVTTARVGRLAARTLTAGADAALNTAAVQAVTAPERARLGDDVSWQALGENVAFAAAAGFLFGGVLGGIDAVRTHHAPKPSIDTVSPAALDAAAPGSFRLETSEDGGVRVVADHPVNVLLDRFETPQARAQSAAVMNDAVSGLVIDDEVRLGAQSKANVQDLQAAMEKARVKQAWEVVHANPHGSVNDPLVHITPEDIEGSILSRGAFKKFNQVEFSDRGYGLVKIIWRHGPEAGKREAEQFRITQEDIAQFPAVIRNYDPLPGSAPGHREWRVELSNDEHGKRVVVFADKLMGDGNRHVVTAYVQQPGLRGSEKPLSIEKTGNGEVPFRALRGHFQDTSPAPLQSMQSGSPIAGTENIVSPELLAKSSANFSVPAPEPRPAQLAASYRVVDSLPKASGSPDADLAHLVESAKAEGLDPLTGHHDLETDLDILRERGVVTPEEEQLLGLADETFKAAEVWEEVTSKLITCKASGS